MRHERSGVISASLAPSCSVSAHQLRQLITPADSRSNPAPPGGSAETLAALS